MTASVRPVRLANQPSASPTAKSEVRRMKPKTVFVCQDAARSRRSGWAAAPTAAPGTRWSRSARAARRRRRRRRARATRWPARVAGAQLYADIETGRRRPALDRHRRVRSRARRRRRARLARAARRRAGHRQVDAAAAGGGALRARRSGPCSTARARSPSTRSSRAASGSASATRRSICWPRPASSASSRRSRASSRRCVIVDSIQTVFSLKFQSAPGQHRPGARGGDAAAVRGQGPEHADVPRRPRHQGRQPRRPQGARARRRHGAVLRGRAPPLASRRARGEEPLRRGQRARRVRDDRRRPAAGAESRRQLFLAERPPNAPGSAVLCCVEGSRPMLVEVQALVSTSTYGTARRMASGIDQQPPVAAARGAREARRPQPDRRRRVRERRRRHDGRRAGGRPRRRSRRSPRACGTGRFAPTTAVFGEVGLAGEVRGATQAALRVREAARWVSRA